MKVTEENTTWLLELVEEICYLPGRPNNPKALLGFTKRLLPFIVGRESGEWLMGELGMLDRFPTVRQAYVIYTGKYPPARELSLPEVGQ